MPSSEVFDILKAWKNAELGIFCSWASATDRSATAFVNFEGWVVDVDEEALRVGGEPSSRIKGTDEWHAFFSLSGAVPSKLDPEHVRFTFPSGAILDLVLS
jgi:hypothetical protein